MADEHQIATSPSRFARLIAKFRGKAYRDSYVRSHTKQFLARQMRAFRGDKSQKEFAKMIGVSQSVVSGRLENPNYGKSNLQTLFNVAEKLNVAVFVRFVDYPTFLGLTKDMSDTAIRPLEYDKHEMDRLAEQEILDAQFQNLFGDTPSTATLDVHRAHNGFDMTGSGQKPLRVA